MKQLKPIEIPVKYEEQLEKEVFATMKQAMFSSVLYAIREYNNTQIDNANGALREALKRGKIQYKDGSFYGKFNTKLSRELKKLGASFNKRTKTWYLSELPGDLYSAVVYADARAKALYQSVVDALDTNNIQVILDNADFTGSFEKSINQMEQQFKVSVSAVGIKPSFSDDMIKSISEQYSNNMKLYIKDWLEKDILSLREKVEKNAFTGYRAESLIKTIQEQYGVSQRKAKFLASQETRLLTGQFTQERYKSAGVTKYRWSTSNDSRVREDHKELHGKIFQWGEAIIDDKGTRGNPKEAFGCRCKAIPILD